MRYRPGGTRVGVDSRETTSDPELFQRLDEAAEQILRDFIQLPTPTEIPGMICHIARTRYLPGGRLVAWEVIAGIVAIDIRHGRMSDDLIAALQAANTRVGHYLARR